MIKRHTLNSAIKAAREAAGMTQEDVADAVGVHQMTVSRWERGTIAPKEDQLATLAALLSTTPGALRYGNGAARSSDPSISAEERVPVIALSLPKEVRVWMHEFLLDLARADVSDREIEEARAVLTSPENATWWKDATPKEMLTAIESFADIIRDILRRRGYKLKASK